MNSQFISFAFLLGVLKETNEIKRIWVSDWNQQNLIGFKIHYSAQIK